MKLTLEDGAYAWEFLPGGGILDQLRGTCLSSVHGWHSKSPCQTRFRPSEG